AQAITSKRYHARQRLLVACPFNWSERGAKLEHWCSHEESMQGVKVSRIDSAGDVNSLSLIDVAGPESDDLYRALNAIR
ncbi:unnamed protein product, partial [Prorocentrum cordatum]